MDQSSFQQFELESNTMSLYNRETLVPPGRFRSEFPKVERRTKQVVSHNLFRLLLVENIGIKICGGVIEASGLQACVDDVTLCITSCAVQGCSVHA